MSPPTFQSPRGAQRHSPALAKSLLAQPRVPVGTENCICHGADDGGPCRSWDPGVPRGLAAGRREREGSWTGGFAWLLLREAFFPQAVRVVRGQRSVPTPAV